MSTVANMNFEEGLSLSEFIGSGVVLKIKAGSHPKAKALEEQLEKEGLAPISTTYGIRKNLLKKCA